MYPARRLLLLTNRSRVDGGALRYSRPASSPESYRGRLLVLGGEILNANRHKKSTQIELLQLPLTQGDVEYQYLTVIVKHLHVWPAQSYGQRQRGTLVNIFGGMEFGGGTRGGGGFGLRFCFAPARQGQGKQTSVNKPSTNT